MPDDPLLFAGFNADPINDDETNGAGTNWPVWPVLFDTFVGLVPLIITQEMLDAFNECPDLVLPAADDVITFPFEDLELMIGDAWPDLVIPAENNIITFPAGAPELKVRDHSAEVPIAGGSDTLILPRGAGEQVIRRRR